MTVYVVQDPRRYNRGTGEYEPVFDLTPAEEFGELRFLLSPTAAPFDAQSIVDDLRSGLEFFSSDDHLLLIGNPALIGMATAVAADINEGHVHFLQWHGRKRAYVEVEVHLFDLDLPLVI